MTGEKGEMGKEGEGRPKQRLHSPMKVFLKKKLKSLNII
ncbi:hypothetical protein LEP1GSC051_0490 [Leptospira sp. P2653]|nr:hypothetical protein LEP1GSC051_0490 [Leptospira sp. P2653]